MKSIGIWVIAAFLFMIPGTIALESSASAVGSKAPSSAPGARKAKHSSWSLGMLALVNAQRALSGAGPLALCAPLMRAADGYAREMAGSRRFDHVGADGRGPSDRVSAAGYRFRMMGENIAAGQLSIESVMRSWLDSPSHKEILLSPQYTHLGVGQATADGAGALRYWVQEFGTGGRC